MSIPAKYIINDIRSLEHFKIKSFSGYSTKEVISIFKKKISGNNIEEACNWGIELLLSLHIEKVYMVILDILLKNINISNPGLPHKLYRRFRLFKTTQLSPQDLRNSQIIRNHIIELCVIACMSNKNTTLLLITIKDEDMDITLLIKKFKADKNYIEYYFKSNDPPELKIILNEFIYYLINKNYNLCVYMLSWIINYDKLSTKKKKTISCQERYNSNIQKKHQTDIIWFLWEIIIIESQKKFSKKIYTQVQYLYELYKLYYKPGSKYKYITIFLFALKYFTDLYDINTPLLYNNYICIQLCLKVNVMIHEKKHLEVLQNKQVIFNTEPSKKKKTKQKTAKR